MTQKITRPPLRRIPLDTVWPLGRGVKQRVITMSPGQWDGVLAAAYALNWVLLEVNRDERPVGAYQRADPS
jgi:hypothetical protein